MIGSTAKATGRSSRGHADASAWRGALPGRLFFGLACALLLVDIFRGFWDHDSGFYFLQSLMIAEGLRPFIDFRTIYPPLYNAINAVPIALGIDRWLLVWAVPFAWALAIAGLTGWYWRREWPSMSPSAPWVLAGLFPLFCIDSGGNHNTLELGIVLFGLVALIACGPASEAGRAPAGPRLVLAGVAVGAAFLVKQPGALLLLPFLVLCRAPADALRLIAGFLLPVLLCLLWLDFDFAAIDRSLQALSGYLSRDPPKSLASRLWRFLTILPRDVPRTPAVVAFLVLVVVLGVRAARRELRLRRWRPALWLAAWLAVGGAYLGARAVNDFPHYTLNVWPACVALLAASLRAHPAVEARRLVAGALASAIVASLALSPWLRTLDHEPYFLRWRSEGMAGGYLRPVADELKTLVPSDRSIAQLGMEESVVLFLADRVPLNRDWAGHEIRAEISGDVILFVDYGQKSAQKEKARIRAAGYAVVEEWHRTKGGATLGTIILYSKYP